MVGMHMQDVVFYETFEEEERALKRFLPPAWRVGFSREPVVSAEGPPADVISVRTQSFIPDGWGIRLKGILSRSTGYDHLTRYLQCTKTAVPCGYLPEYCSRAVAEHAILLLMALWRRLSRQSVQFQTFDRDGLTGGECLGKKVLVVGVGRIGLAVAELARAMGMEVRGVDVQQGHAGKITYVSLNEGVSWADALVCAASLTESSIHLLNYKTLREAQPGALLVNVSRGEITPTEDVARLLREDVLGGAGLDVFEDEPSLARALRCGRPADTRDAGILAELVQRYNVICTPHNAFNTREALDRKARLSVEALKYFFQRGMFPHDVTL